jgi:protein-tyrosine phosphatase
MKDPKFKLRILFVCLGNICRSPAAAAVFHKLLEERNLLHLFILDSAGTSGYHDGELADPRTRRVALSKGIEITHVSRRFKLSDFREFDFIYVMDNANLNAVSRMARTEEEKNKVSLFRKFENQSLDLEVPDPYYGDTAAFENVHQILSRASSALLNHLLENDRNLSSLSIK